MLNKGSFKLRAKAHEKMDLYKELFNPLFKIIPIRQLVDKVGSTIVPLYHCVSDREVPHVKHLYQIKNIHAFSKDLDFLLKYYEPVNLVDFKDTVDGKRKLTRPAMLLTFDDGLRECHDIISPILLKKGVPAVFFLNSGFIDNKDLFYRYKVSLIIEEITNNKGKLKAINRNMNLKRTIAYLKSLRYDDISLIDQLASGINLSFTNYLKEENPYMNSTEIRSLINSGFHIGSHSINHPNYTHICFEEQLRQTILSTDFISENFKIDYRTFAFPFTDRGVSLDFYHKILNHHCELTFGTSGARADQFTGSVQRIPFEMGDSPAQAILAQYLTAIFLRKMTRTFYIERKDKHD